MASQPEEAIVCPACGQGWVVPVRVRARGVPLWLCDECDSTWFRREHIGTARVTGFVNYMESNGLKGLWTEIERR